MTEHVRFVRDAALGVELLSARYVTHRFGLHTHDTYVVGVVTGGAARFLSGGRGYVCPSGTLMLIEPEEAHTGGAGVAAGWSYRMLYPSPALLQRLTGTIPSFGPRVVVDRPLARTLLAAHAALAGTADELAKETLAVAAFGLLVRRHAGVQDRAPSPVACAWIVERVRAHVAEHFAERITLADLARVAEVSPFHLARVVKRGLGLAPHAYVNQVRIRHARVLLARGGAPAEVALAVGFCDQSHLGRHFKRTVGVSPAQFAG